MAEVLNALDISSKLMCKESLLIEVAASLLFAHVHPRLSALPIPHPLACILNSMSTTCGSSSCRSDGMLDADNASTPTRP